jgi:hypothetical protein
VRWLLLAVLLSACTDDDPVLTVYAGADTRDLALSFLAGIPLGQTSVVTSDDPARDVAASTRSGPRIALVADGPCADCYRIDGTGGRYTIHAGAPLGVQYGLAELLEAMGVRFFHPDATFVPAKLQSPDGSSALGHDFAPEKRLRGLHLHTIHPIEAYQALWASDPGADQDATAALRIVDWIIRNRGNYVQWSALDDIFAGGAPTDRYRARARAVLDYAHARGVRVGIGVELFSGGNLQNSADLLGPDDLAHPDPPIHTRLHTLLDGLPFDRLNLSFGEFFGADPAAFIQAVNSTWTGSQDVAPGIELAATVHLGNYANLQVTYMGQTMLYYYLVQFADPHVIPWVHTVMYYDLFEDAGGAYGYDDFSTHRQFLMSRLAAGQPAGYFPEDAYWVAFDDSVPLYLPLYQRSRWLDLSQIGPSLQEHVIFSSGWEWGYWQNDYAALRMSYQLPAAWDATLKQMFAPWGAELGSQIAKLAELQHDALIGQRLAPYLAGRDQILDAGGTGGIVAQPSRVSFADVMAMTPGDRAAFTAAVVDPLAQLGDGTEAILPSLDASDPWLAEIRDGVAIDLARTRFAEASYRAALSFADSGTDAGWLARTEDALAEARTIVDRRHRQLHGLDSQPLITRHRNSTLYGFGYLYMAQTLCYWNREHAQLRNLILHETNPDPGCAL